MIDFNTSWTVLIPIAIILLIAWRWGGWANDKKEK